MEYSTQKGKLVMPEYGRNIQQMIDYALTIEDRAERTRCVQTIVYFMGNFFPYLRDVNDFKHKLWDHVAVMSDFKLDIDYPYEIAGPESLRSHPERMEYPSGRIRYMHYGRMLEEMIVKAADYPEGEEREVLIRLLANQMKKCLITWNKEVAEDRKIYDDLRELSGGKIDLPDDYLRLIDSKEPVYNNRKNKKQQK